MAKLQFFGAVEGVTGSCFLLTLTRGQLLIDCGMHQGERMCSKKNLEALPFVAADIAAVLVTHAHFDHTGRLPQLVKEGYRGTIFMTPPTKGITEIILEDSVNVMRENASKCGDPMPYQEAEVRTAMGHCKGVGYHTEFEPIPGIRVMFHDAGHILGSSYVTVDLPADESATGAPQRLVFSGDIGNDDVPILPDTEAIDHADVVICEATYGAKDHDPVETRGKHLAEYVQLVIGRGGTLMIPSFSVERTQELLYELDLLLEAKVIPHVPIYLDSPLSIKATELYRHFRTYLRFDHPASPDGDFFSFPSLKETLSQNESLAIDNDRRPKIIIAGNGMMTGGRILRHLSNHLSDAKSGVLIIGFQGAYTLGRKIQDGAKEVKIHNRAIPVAASVFTIEAFSAHGDRGKISRWLKPEHGDVPKVFLVHGEPETKAAFKTYLFEHDITDVTIPQLTETFEV